MTSTNKLRSSFFSLGILCAFSPNLAAAQQTLGQQVQSAGEERPSQTGGSENEGGGSQESNGGTGEIEWRRIVQDFDPLYWGEQEKVSQRISFPGRDFREVEIGLRDGDTLVAGPGDWDRERAELFLYHRVVDQWFSRFEYVGFQYELQLASDFDVNELQRGDRRIFQVKSVKGSGRPIFDVVIKDGTMQIRHHPVAVGPSKPIILASGPAPDPSKEEWLPVGFEARFTESQDGYFKMRVGNLVGRWDGQTQHDYKLNNIKLGEYRNQDYSSGSEAHHMRNPLLRIGWKKN
jgi:hypothetical protein